jgi:hypothetical protein
LRKSKWGGGLTFEQRDCEITTVFISFEQVSLAITTRKRTCLLLIDFGISVSEETGKGKHIEESKEGKKDRTINRIRQCSVEACAKILGKRKLH